MGIRNSPLIIFKSYFSIVRADVCYNEYIPKIMLPDKTRRDHVQERHRSHLFCL